MRSRLLPWIVVCAGVFPSAPARGDSLYALQTGQIHLLTDNNGDGDFLDFSEVRLFADGLATGVSVISSNTDAIFALNPGSRAIVRISDLNEDGDALDFGEVLSYADLPAGPAGPTTIRATADGRVFATDSGCGCLYLIRDLNQDGDAFDAFEVTTIASGLTSPVSISTRTDGVLLIAQQSAQIPVRILRDRNGDGDFFDFAENISYAESITAGTVIESLSSRQSYLLRPSDGTIQTLDDLTGDDDVLDFAEIRLFAGGLTTASGLAIAEGGAAYVSRTGTGGGIWRIEDSNGDGDALDFNEAVQVATGMTNIIGLTHRSTAVPECLNGDADENGMVGVSDIAPLTAALLGITVPGDICRVDVNDDGVLNGHDVRSFVGIITGP